MKMLRLIVASSLCITLNSVNAQYLPGKAVSTISPTLQDKCGFDHVHQRELINNPDYLKKTEEFELMLKSFAPDKAAATYKIPVVVHVMSTNSSLTAITDQQIRDVIEGLNARLRKVAGRLGDGNGVDMSIEYALAVRDPNGNCTNGIVRYDMTGNATYMSSGVRGSTTTGITEASLKALSVWDQSRYYNIWLVSEIDGNNGSYGIQGYAYFASSHGTALDGAVMTVNTVKNAGATTFIHELGHSLDLYHTFEGDGSGSTCPTNTSCSTQGDRVCDTPPHRRSNSDCVVGTNSCDGNSSTNLFIHNYMDYSNDACQNMFTAGQKTRVLAAISVTRASFLEANGNMALVPVSAPTADFHVNRSAMCSTGQSVTLWDVSSCSPNTFMAETAWTGSTWSWTITNNAGTTYTSTLQNPTITFNATGVYDVSLTVTTSAGSSTVSKRGVIVVGTQSAPTACTPSSSNNGNFGNTLSTVTFNTISNSTSNFLNFGYTDYSCTYNTVVAPNKTYPISLTLNSAGSGAEVAEVYIDYNADGDFLDAGEQVFTGSAANNTSATVTGNITIPATATQNRPLRMRVYAEAGTLTTNEKNCSASMLIGDVEDYSIYVSAAVASVSIAASASTITYPTSVTFTATQTNGGTTPTYQWYLNGVAVSGQTGATYVTSTLVNGDKVSCVMSSNLANVFASPATSNTVTMTVTGKPQSEFSVNTTSGCTSTSFAFSDKSTLAPTSWAWTFTGGSPASSTAQNPSVTYATPGTYSVTLVASNANGTGTTMTKTGYITVTAAPTGACTVTRSLTPANGVGITNVVLNTISNATANNDAVASNFTCSKTTTLETGKTYNITAMGSTTTTQWMRAYIDFNNDGDFVDAGENIWSPANTTGTRAGTFTVPASPTLNTLLRMRVITDDLTTTPGPCTTPLRYGQYEDYGVYIVLGCTPVSPAVSIASSDADNSFCSGTSVTFTATPTNGGTTPAYQWKVNGGNVGSNASTFNTSSLANGDVVTCVMTSNASCASPSSATSSGITNTVITTVTPAVSIASSDADNSFCAGTSVTFTATPTNGGSTPAYQWKLNGGNVGTNSTSYNNAGLVNGDVVTVVMTANNTCQTTATANATGITNTVITNVTPTVSIASSDADNSFCSGTSVTFTATPTNGGSTPAYQWKLNGGNVGTNSTSYNNASLVNGDVVTLVMTANNTCQTTATANATGITNTVITNVTPTVSIASSDADNSFCAGTSVTFTATPTNGGSTPAYQWKLNGGNVGSNSTSYNNASLVNGDVVTVVMTANNTCQTSATATATGITNTVITNVTPTVSIASSDADNSFCAGTSVTFTATPTNGGSTPAYQWKLNGGNVGSNSTSYNNAGLVNGDVVTLVMTANNTCQTTATANATGITNTVITNVTPTVSIASSDVDNSFCSGTSVTFTATPTNGGSTPAYQWKVNGGNIGTNASTFNSSSLVNGDVVTVVMTANNTCQTTSTATSSGISNTVITSVTPTVSIASSDADNSFCAGTSVTFTATPTNGGSTPTYQWKLNGGNVGTNSTSYNNAGLVNGDIVSVVMTANNTCQTTATANATGITNTVITNVTPTVSIASSDADNSFCSGTSVTFTATPTNGGSTPAYQWKLNGGNVGTNSTSYNNAGLVNGDVVTLVMTANNTCQTTATANATGITNTVITNVTPTVSIASSDADNSFCSGTSVTFTATPTNGGSTPAYQWKVNGGNVGTNSTSYNNAGLVNGDVVTVVMTANNTCQTSATATATGITNTVITNVTPTVSIASSDADNSFCAGTSVTFTATPTNGGSTPTYQWKLNGGNVGSNSTSYNNAGLVNGDVVTVVMTANNTCQTTATANATGITNTVITNITPTVSIASSDADNSFCSGTSVTFTATPTNGGSTPAYQWKLNGGNVGTNSTSYNNAGLVNGDVVTVVMTANNTCQTTATANATGITNTVITNVTPTVSIASSDADNSFCSGTSVTFTATPTNGGSTPAYQWKVNGGNVGTNASTFNSSSLVNGDVVTVVMTSNATCPSPAMATSSGIANNVIAIPAADAPSNVASCGAYSLPALMNGYYFSASGGTGTAYAAGNAIGSNMTMFVFAESGTTPNCVNEHSFTISIDAPVTADNPADVRACSQYELPMLSAGNDYYTGAGGTGSMLNANDVLTSTQTVYVRAVNGVCSNENDFVVNVFSCITLDAASCDATLTNMSDAIYAQAVPGATNYRFKVENGLSSYVATSITGNSSNFFRLTWLSSANPAYGTTYTVTTSAMVGGLWMPFGDPCTITTPATRIMDSYANTILSDMSDALNSYDVAGADDYRYEIRKQSDNSLVTVSTRGANDNLFRFSWAGGLVEDNMAYTVRVSAHVGSVWQAYGPSVVIYTPVHTKLASTSCDISIPTLTTALYSDPVASATDYRYEIRKASDNSFVGASTRGSNNNLFRLSWLSGGLIQNNTTYTVRVAVFVGGVWSHYGSPCNVTTPASFQKEQTIADELSALETQELIQVYPNPTNGSFQINSNQTGEFSLSNELGQIITRIKIDESGHAQVDGLAAGVYFVSGRTSIIKVIVH